jgi:peptidoglycan hydrolase-like protein with peptidoglycan-binding domain
MADIVMYDSIDISQIPLNAAAVAGYVDGQWPTYSQLAARFPHAQRLSIAVTASADADCLDIEPGDATVSSAAGWYNRQKARGLAVPVFYCSVSTMNADLVPAINAAGIPRSSVRLWSAHYGAGEHICGPATCRLLSTPADGTQYTDAALGRNLDASLLLGSFFGAAAPPWEIAMLAALPTVSQGAKDADLPHWYVHRIQLIANGVFGASPQLTVDGTFGPSTTNAVMAIQRGAGLTGDGVVGPATWPVILVGSGA